jgi:Flp pilus assembly protein TadD
LTDAAGHLNTALQIQPKDPSTLKTLAALQFRQGKLPEAIGSFRESLAQRNDPEVHFALAGALLATRQTSEAITHLEESLRLKPGWPSAANNLAWILATHPDSTIRNGTRAVELANEACRATNHAVPEVLLTYAAALAEVGRFDEAVTVVRDAIAIAKRSDNLGLGARAQSQLERYRNRQPLRSDP